MTGRRRNFSPWAHWSLHLQSVRAADPMPGPDADDAAFAAWRDRVRTRVVELLGPMPDPVPLDVEIGEPIDRGDHVRRRVVFDSEATMSVPAWLLVPADRAAPGSAVLAVHGHGAGKDLICGLTGPAHEHYALDLVRAGHVVLAPDLRCFGERQDPQWDPEGHKYDCDWNLVAATMAGRTPLGQNVWDLQRALDLLVAHPLVDPLRLGVAGLSYGGTLTLFVAALDERVRAAVVSGYLSSWASAHRVPWNMCGSQVMFGQLGAFEHLDIAALVAPRPLLVETGTDDPIFPVDAARATVAALGPVWDRLGAPDVLVHDVFAGGHRWHGSQVPGFLASAFGTVQA